MTTMTTRRTAPGTPHKRVRGTGCPGYTVTLACLPPSVAVARQATRTTVECWGLPESLVADAELIVSELVTNAIRHTGVCDSQEPARCRLTVERPTPDTVRIAVWDRSATRPVKRTPERDDTGGRGLSLVQALALEWGATRRPVGKTVWAVLKVQP